MIDLRKEKSRVSRIIGVYGVLVTLSIIWGIAFVAIKILEPMISPINLTLLRWFIASLGFLALLPVYGRLKTRISLRDIPRLILVSFANVVAYHLTINYSEGFKLLLPNAVLCCGMM